MRAFLSDHAHPWRWQRQVESGEADYKQSWPGNIHLEHEIVDTDQGDLSVTKAVGGSISLGKQILESPVSRTLRKLVGLTKVFCHQICCSLHFGVVGFDVNPEV